nr:hypothetical protein [Tanacetum cinerariifolium]
NAIYKRCNRLKKGGKNKVDLMKRAREIYRDENKNNAFSHEDAWAILQKHAKWDAPDLASIDLTEEEHVPSVNIEELFGPNARPRPPDSMLQRCEDTNLVLNWEKCHFMVKEETDNSLSMGDEHLDTIPAMKSDEVIKSSVEDLVPIPSEFEGIPDTMCDVHLDNNPTPLEAKNHFETVINSKDDISSSDDDSLYKENIEYVEASPYDSELVSLKAAEIVIPEEEEIEDDNLREKFSGSTTTHSDISLPDYEAFSFNNDHIKEISSGSTATHSNISLFEYELAHVISPPEYDCFYFWNLPDPGELMSVLNSGIHENLSSTTRVNLPFASSCSQPMLKSSYKAKASVIISIPPLVGGVADVVVEIKGTVVSAVEGNWNNAVKSSAGWIWRPKENLIDHISKDSRSYTLQRFNYDQGIFNSGCSRHMTRTSPTSQIIKKLMVDLLHLEEMLKELLDKSQVLLKVPRNNNMYSFDLKNVVLVG